jgi:hypothetical protein
VKRRAFFAAALVPLFLLPLSGCVSVRLPIASDDFVGKEPSDKAMAEVAVSASGIATKSVQRPLSFTLLLRNADTQGVLRLFKGPSVFGSSEENGMTGLHRFRVDAGRWELTSAEVRIPGGNYGGAHYRGVSKTLTLPTKHPVTFTLKPGELLHVGFARMFLSIESAGLETAKANGSTSFAFEAPSPGVLDPFCHGYVERECRYLFAGETKEVVVRAWPAAEGKLRAR